MKNFNAFLINKLQSPLLINDYAKKITKETTWPHTLCIHFFSWIFLYVKNQGLLWIFLTQFYICKLIYNVCWSFKEFFSPKSVFYVLRINSSWDASWLCICAFRTSVSAAEMDDSGACSSRRTVLRVPGCARWICLTSPQVNRIKWVARIKATLHQGWVLSVGLISNSLTVLLEANVEVVGLSSRARASEVGGRRLR